jgi:short-subunit dehydrogenase
MFEEDILSGETAVVTGASRGIGQAIAETLAAHGADVVVTARSEDALAQLASRLESEEGVRTLVVPTDVRDEKGIDSLATQATDFGNGSIEILVANAGANFHASIAEMSRNAWTTIVDINLTGTYHSCHVFADALTAADQGRVLTLSSVFGRDGHPESTHYAASKAGIETFT